MLTPQLAWTSLVAYLGMFQLGFHLGELNAPLGVISCRVNLPGPYPTYDQTFWGAHGFPQCIPMNENALTVITTMFTVGGLVGSLCSGHLSDRFGRKRTATLNALLFLVGAIVMATATSERAFIVARLMNGLAAGSSIVVIPILINEVAPLDHRGLFGALAQLAVSLGLVVVMLVGYLWANSQQWRNMFGFSAVVALLTFMAVFSTVESPKWLIHSTDNVSRATSILSSLRVHRDSVPEEISGWRRASHGSRWSLEWRCLGDELALVADEDVGIEPVIPSSFTFVTAAVYRQELRAIGILMSAQQFTGTNSITYYGVSILLILLPQYALLVVVGLSVTSTLSFALFSPLVDRIDRRKLLLTSLSFMGVALTGVGYALNHRHPLLCVGCCALFQIAYALGIGPIPFLMISELAHGSVVGLALSVGSTLSWCSNIAFAYTFPLVYDALGGYTFSLLALLCGVYIALVWSFVPETRSKNSHHEVWLT